MFIHGVDWNSTEFYLHMGFLILGLILLFYQICSLWQAPPLLSVHTSFVPYLSSLPPSFSWKSSPFPHCFPCVDSSSFSSKKEKNKKGRERETTYHSLPWNLVQFLCFPHPMPVLSKLIVSSSCHRLPTLYQTPRYRKLLSELVFVHNINKYILLIIVTTIKVIPSILMMRLNVMVKNKYGKKDSLCYMELRWIEDAFKQASTTYLKKKALFNQLPLLICSIKDFYWFIHTFIFALW